MSKYIKELAVIRFSLPEVAASERWTRTEYMTRTKKILIDEAVRVSVPSNLSFLFGPVVTVTCDLARSH